MQTTHGTYNAAQPQRLMRVREKNQVTLPKALMDACGLNSPGHLQYIIFQDGVLIRPFVKPEEDSLAKIRRLAQSMPSSYDDSQSVDEFISQQRDAWSR